MFQSKRLAAFVLAASMLFGVCTAASAADTASQDYSISVSDKQVVFTRGGESAAYAARSNNLTLQIDDENDLLVCFNNKDNVYKGISLGSQRSLIINGSLDTLTLDASLGNATNITIPAGTSVSKISVANKGRLDIYGNVTTLTCKGSANVYVKDGAVVGTANTISTSAKITIETGATVKRSTSDRASSRSYRDDDDDDYDDDYDDDKLPVTLEVSSISIRLRDYNDDVLLEDIEDELEDSVEAYYYDDDGRETRVRGRVRWDNPNKKIIDDDNRRATSYSCGFTFKPSSSKYQSVSRNIRVYVE